MSASAESTKASSLPPTSTGAQLDNAARVPAAPRLRMTTRMGQNPWIQRSIVWGALLLGWEIVARKVGAFFLPTVGSIVTGYGDLVQDGAIGLFAGSMRQMLVGYLFAAVVGTVLGLFIGAFRPVAWLLDQYVTALFVTSLSALLPFIILLFGTGFQFRVAVVFLYSVFYPIMITASGVRSVDRGLLQMAASYQAGFLRQFVSVTIPGALPYVMSGLRLGLGQAVQGMIIAELWITVDTGRKLTSLALARELGQFFALAAAIAVIGAALTHVLAMVQRRLTPWMPDVQTSIRGAS